jgi:hypothetical protein
MGHPRHAVNHSVNYHDLLDSDRSVNRSLELSYILNQHPASPVAASQPVYFRANNNTVIGHRLAVDRPSLLGADAKRLSKAFRTS